MSASPLFALLLLLNGGDEKSLSDRLSFSADGRLRAESTFDQTNGEDRHRGRIRIRVNAMYEIMEGLKAGARFTTRSDGNDANNLHWDFGDGEDGLAGGDVGFDRFYLEWEACEMATLYGGKFAHVYTSPPVYSEFVWDGDVQPAGVAGIFDLSGSGDSSFDVRTAGYVVEENGGDDDPSMLGVQANFGTPLGDATKFNAATSLSVWGSLNALNNPPDQGNTPGEDFSVWETYVAAKHQGGPLGGQTGFVQFVNNLDDDSGEDTGFAAGLELGGSSTSYFLVYYDFDANCMFSPVAQDDTPIAGTGTGNGMSGFMAGLKHALSDRMSVKFWALTSDADDVEDPYRLRIDLDFKVK